MGIVWHGDEIARMIDAEVDRRIGAAAALFHAECQKVLSKSYPPASKPGEPPHGRTWNLRTAVTLQWVKGSLKALVGLLDRAAYGVFLESGTGRMAARPWFWVTLERIRPMLVRLVGRPI